MKKYKHGMVLGKFYPPTNGHKFLIDTALEQCEGVTLFMCSLKRERITGALRYYWLQLMYFNQLNLRIVWIQDELPQTPEEYGDFDGFYKLWVDTVHSHETEMDVLFTSEDYGDEFAEKLNIKHVLVDLDREKHPVSGTDVRDNPMENWEHIPNEVKPYFKKKIVIMGTESTGKTTLTKKLAEHFDGDFVSEYGRDFTDNNPATEMNVEDFETIAKIHNIRIMDTATKGTKKLMFVDTDAIVTKIFGKMYLGDTFKSRKINDIIERQDFDLVLLCDIDVPWVDDGTRDFPNEEDRKRHLDKILRELELREQPYKMICGNYDERFELAKKYVNKLLI